MTIAVDLGRKATKQTKPQYILQTFQDTFWSTVKTVFNVTRYNRIFNIRHKVAGNGSVSIKIPSL